MNISIINGSPDPQIGMLDQYVNNLCSYLEARGNQVNHFILRERDIRFCIGCFGCWVKTPGKCVVGDESAAMGRAVINSDFTLWAAPLRMGFPATLLKKALDKHIPLIHPYFDVVHYEAHHRARSKKYPRLGLLLEREATTDQRDLEIISDIFSRTALNLKSRLEFCLLIDDPIEKVAALIERRSVQSMLAHPHPLLAPGGQIPSLRRLTVFNGSPRGRKGNTPILLSHFSKGFTSINGNNVEVFHLNRLNDLDSHRQAFAQAECVLLGFPLYTDAMPGMVKAFIDRLEAFGELEANPPILFLVQSGFPEAAHSRYVQRYLEKLAERLHSPYLGTMVKGSGEGLRLMPEEMNTDLFENLQQLGKGFAADGRLDPERLTKLSNRERYPRYLAPVYRLLAHTPLLNFYWDMQLKQNNAYERRFARPYLEPGK